MHRTVDAISYFLTGYGQIWRPRDNHTEIVEVRPGAGDARAVVTDHWQPTVSRWLIRIDCQCSLRVMFMSAREQRLSLAWRRGRVARVGAAGAHIVHSRLWTEDPELRRSTGQELNKGESRNSLARAVFIHRLGEIRDRTYENQQHRASGLNFLVTAIILWNTRYLERAVGALRRTEEVPDHLLVHLSPLGWEHINLTGDYVWVGVEQMTENPDGFRPLRSSPSPFDSPR